MLSNEMSACDSKSKTAMRKPWAFGVYQTTLLTHFWWLQGVETSVKGQGRGRKAGSLDTLRMHFLLRNQ